MTAHTKDKYNPISQQQINDLTAIYDDYLYITRQHEQLLQRVSMEDLAFSLIDDMQPDGPNCDWQVEILSIEEKREFIDFIKDNGYSPDNNKAYIVLRHIKAKENVYEPPVFSIPPYMHSTINMELPSSIERCTIVYPKNRVLGDTEFYVDGIYKVFYTGEKSKKKSLEKCVNNQRILNELCMMINLTENFLQNDYAKGSDLEKRFIRVYAAERILTNENIILEIMGSFAEKLLGILRSRYNIKNTSEVLQRAQDEGIINSATDFQDYLNLRNFMRHQWDTLDELGYFSITKSNKISETRNGYVNSYLKICDKSILQRVKTYIDVLHQMQHVIYTINQNRIIRGISESNSKFTERLKTLGRQNQGQNMFVEINHPLANDKYQSLNRNLHKLLPRLNIIDDFNDITERQKNIDFYSNRSWFLQMFHSIECLIMRHCITRGRNLRKRDAWNYMAQIGVLSKREYQIWDDYIDLRNKLSHNYFDQDLRNMLCQIEDKFFKDWQILANRIMSDSPDVRKVKDNIYEYKHRDGTIVRLDFKYHTILHGAKSATPQNTTLPTNNAPRRSQPNPKPQQENYAGGIEYDISGNKIISIKLPIGVNINFDKQSITWGGCAHWVPDDKFNVLRTEKNKIITYKDLEVSEFFERNNRRPVRRGDNLLLDLRHNVVLDKFSKIKEFRFKMINGNVIQTVFNYTKDGQITIMFNDGVCVSYSGADMVVTYCGKTLNYDNRQEFAAKYCTSKAKIQQIGNQGIVR